MDWDGSLTRSSFVNPRPDSSNASSFTSFLFNSSFDHLPGNMEVKHHYHHHPFGMAGESSQAASGLGAENYISSGYVTCYNNNNNNNNSQERKKKLTSEQLDSLESSFQEEIKLDPDRKMKLSRELGLQPRQIAVWFQNRRARWKAKELERLYDALKLEFDAISREKLKLQQEVLRLKGMIRDQATTKNTARYTDVSGEETVESTSINIHTNTPRESATTHQFGATLVEYNNTITAAATYWGNSIGPSLYNNNTSNP